MHNRSRFSRQVDAGSVKQAELLKIFIIIVHAETQPHRYKNRITGVHRCLYEIFRSVPGNFMTPDTPVFHHNISRTAEVIVYRHDALFQRGRGRHCLKRGAGFISIVNAAVTPHGIQQFLPLLCV